ncbi:hypothetical protein BN1222_03571 [Klebsiella quasipneumoniae]|nr:hypothetical protein BN1222_03571 [Klebsiella quasipneumoniae]
MAYKVELKLSNKEVRRLNEVAYALGYDDTGELMQEIILRLATSQCIVNGDEWEFHQTRYNDKEI